MKTPIRILLKHLKNQLAILLILGSTVMLTAQDASSVPRPTPLSNSINLNLLGDASLISLNYDRLFSLGDNLFLSTKLGIGYGEESNICVFKPCAKLTKYTTIPFHAILLTGKGRFFLEYGLGATMISGDPQPAKNVLPYGIVGMRIIPFEAPITLRIYGSVPLSGFDTDESNHGGILFVPFGLSLGRMF